MKKFLTILAIAIVSALAYSCGASKTIENNPYKVTATGYANDQNIARQKAIAAAQGEIMQKFHVVASLETDSNYNQNQTGSRSIDKSNYSQETRTYSEGTIDNMVVEIKPIPRWKCRPHKYGYTVTVTVNPENIQSRI